MAVLPWVRLATDLPENPKILELLSRRGGSHTAFVYLCSLSYSGKKGTFGRIPKAALPFIHATAKDAKALVEVGLWNTPDDPKQGGWQVHDWDVYQPSKEYVQNRKDKARNAALARWNKNPENSTGNSQFDDTPPF